MATTTTTGRSLLLRHEEVVHRGIDHLFGAITSLFGSATFFSHGFGADCQYWCNTVSKWQAAAAQSAADIYSIQTIHWIQIQNNYSSLLQNFTKKNHSKDRLIEGEFRSPLADFLPEESQNARFLMTCPSDSIDGSTPFVLFLAGTGEHSYTTRFHSLALPLLREGIGSIILENSYYGRRRPANQFGAKLRVVSDLLALGLSTVEEARAILMWLHKQGVRKLCVAGVSQGGLHAAMTVSSVPFGVSVVSAFAPESAEYVFSDGVLSRNLNWKSLAKSRQHSLKLTNEDIPQLRLNEAEDLVSTKQALRDILRQTDIRRFPLPKQPQQSILIAGDSDQYVSPSSVKHWTEHWPWLDVRWTRAGHVSGILFKSKTIRNAITDTF
uniref:AB hydrolase-1 domain-containing protein n=1 Tax=Timspurckia oligopyrenoides TaxID=708627 RepID=A0A6T6LK61_9RHOD|mmetsp:Transcript_11648/g.21087  ORF Transcript_11648/g.21087 Transcript_11648/m.21087 type:complete len:382 (+) Transcript_11648:52-1197(+)